MKPSFYISILVICLFFYYPKVHGQVRKAHKPHTKNVHALPLTKADSINLSLPKNSDENWDNTKKMMATNREKYSSDQKNIGKRRILDTIYLEIPIKLKRTKISDW